MLGSVHLFGASMSNTFSENLLLISPVLPTLLADHITDITKTLNDVVGTTGVDRFMDSATGLGHRIQFGHSLDYVPEIYRRFGVTGLSDYLTHGLRDFMSPHGMPIPFAREVETLLGLTRSQSINWLCLNIGEVLAGSVSLAHSYQLFQNVAEARSIGHIDPNKLAYLATGVTAKLAIGAATTNPVTLASGLFDATTLIWGMMPYLTIGDAYFRSLEITTATAITGSVSASAAGLATGGILHVFTERSFRTYTDRLKKISFSGAVGGFIGVGTSAVTANPIAISAASVGGYVAGEWLFEQLDAVASSSSERTERNGPWLPDFLDQNLTFADDIYSGA